MKYRSSLQHSSVKLLQNRSYFIKLDILAMPLGQSRSGYGLNFSGFILMIFFSLCEMYSTKQFCWLNIEHPTTATHLHDTKWHCTGVQLWCTREPRRNLYLFELSFYSLMSAKQQLHSVNFYLVRFLIFDAFLPLCRAHMELCVLIPLTMSTLVLLPVCLCANATAV